MQIFARTARAPGMTAVAARKNDFLFRLQKFREDQLQARQVRCRPQCARQLRSLALPVALRLEVDPPSTGVTCRH